MFEKLPPNIQEKLIKNGHQHGEDYFPLAMMKIKGSLQVWLLTELEPDAPHTGWGICDHGIGAPYYGWVDLERTEYKYYEEWGLEVLWDESFESQYPYSVYLYAAFKRVKDGESYPGITLDANDLAQAVAEISVQPMSARLSSPRP